MPPTKKAIRTLKKATATADAAMHLINGLEYLKKLSEDNKVLLTIAILDMEEAEKEYPIPRLSRKDYR